MKFLLCFLALAPAFRSETPSPPASRRAPVADFYHGVKVSDPYRWLEDQNSPETKKWIESQNRYTYGWLRTQPVVPYVIGLLAGLSQVQSVTEPVLRGKRLFFTKQSGTDERPILYYRNGLEGDDRVAIDPNSVSEDTNVAVSYADYSDDGRYAVYEVAQGGADEMEVRIRDTQTGKDLPDVLPSNNYPSVLLVGDMSGIYYTEEDAQAGPQMRYHRILTPVSQDKEILVKRTRTRSILVCRSATTTGG